MKKIFLLFFMIFLISGCGNKLKTYHKLSYDEFNKMIENKESFPIVIGRTGCSACEVFEPTMESFISKYQVTVYYMDISLMSTEEFNEFKAIYGISSTPTTTFIKDGVQLPHDYRLVGSVSYSSVVDRFKAMGYVEG